MICLFTSWLFSLPCAAVQLFFCENLRIHDCCFAFAFQEMPSGTMLDNFQPAKNALTESGFVCQGNEQLFLGIFRELRVLILHSTVVGKLPPQANPTNREMLLQRTRLRTTHRCLFAHRMLLNCFSDWKIDRTKNRSLGVAELLFHDDSIRDGRSYDRQ